VQGSYVFSANLHSAVYLINDEFGVEVDPEALDSAAAGERTSFYERLVFRNRVDGGFDPFGDLSN